LKDAIGAQIITNYFPFVDVSKETYPSNYARIILGQLQREAAGKIKLGLDLQGGTAFTVGLDTNYLSQTTQKSQDERSLAISQAIEVLRRRVDKFGVSEPVILPSGTDRIVIQIPGLSEDEKESARRQIEKAAFLEFRMVHPESAEMLRQEIIPAGYEIKKEVTTRGGKETVATYLVTKRSLMTGDSIKAARFDRDPMNGQPQIAFELTSDGAKKFADITTENVGRLLAILLDGQLQSAPVIREPITGGRGQISGSYTDKEAVELANVLENPLKTPVKILESREVDPSLGADSIKKGFNAALYGVIAVAVFMLVYYLMAGLVANVALILNIIILLGIMCYFGTTLTLPGIAGIVLTIGMAVDANVLIYERMREEWATGKSIRGAINAGYDKAFGTILDSNLTTLIASVLLIYMGTGPVKGFGVTLTIGVSVSMFTALVVTRLIFDAMLHLNLIKSLKMLHLVRGSGIDFMKFAKPAFAISWSVIIVGLAYGGYREYAAHQPKSAAGKEIRSIYGVDFAGGDSLTLDFKERVEVDKLRAAAISAGLSDVQIQYQKDISANRETLSVLVPFEKGVVLEKALQKDFPKSEFKVLGRDTVGPSVGKEIKKSAVIAAVVALLGILVYVAMRYEFSFAVAAIISLIHDIFMTLGIFFLSGREMNAPIVAAILTIIGFSINDTIVIFDRIREDLKLGVRGTFKEVMNKALNQTLSRTIITSGTVFLATFSLFIFGGSGTINDFAFCFLTGIITGTYSSIYIASAFVLWYNKGERPALGSNVALDATVAKKTA
jgi:SecD/SecF fusion protein